jgi:hypothetical protein
VIEGSRRINSSFMGAIIFRYSSGLILFRPESTLFVSGHVRQDALAALNKAGFGRPAWKHRPGVLKTSRRNSSL